jgi:MFS family permease
VIQRPAVTEIRPDHTLSTPELPPRSAPDGGANRAGWVIVAVVATILTATAGARYLFGVVLKPVSEQFGWDRASLTGAVSLSMLTLSLYQPFVGLLVDRFGSKRILVLGTVSLGAMLIPLSFATRLWQVYLIYGVLAAFGLAATSPVNVTALVSRWFQHRRGAAMALATSGSAFGQLLIVPLATWTLTITDWQTTYRVLAIVLLLVMAPLGLLLLRDAPPGVPQSRHAARKAPSAVSEIGSTLRASLRTSAFWLLAFGFVACGFTMAFATTHFMAYADDMGMAPMHAADAVGVTAIFSVAGSVLLGLVADRWRRSGILAFTYLLRGIAFLLLLLLPTGNLIFVYAVVLGISWTATTPLTAAIAADLYGPRHLGVIFGTLYTFMNIGFGIGAFLDGFVYETFGNYNAALLLNVALGLLAAVGVWTVAGQSPWSLRDTATVASLSAAQGPDAIAGPAD